MAEEIYRQREVGSIANSVEGARWEAEQAFREREISIQERGQASKEAELDLRKEEHASSSWRNPLVVAIFAATVAAIGNAGVAYTNGISERRLETQRSEQQRILEMIKTGDPNKAAENLKFLLAAGLINDQDIKKRLAEFLAEREPDTGPTLPAPQAAGTSLVTQDEGIFLKAYTDSEGRKVIGSGHVLTDQEIQSGKISIDGKLVDYGLGITSQQVERLLQSDLEPISREIDQLVKVKLTPSQREALITFLWNVGLQEFRSSQLLENSIRGNMMRFQRK